MKKAADNKSDNPKGSELDELSELQQQYDEASVEERERLWPDLIRAIRKIDPSFLQKFEGVFRSGDYLKAQVESAMKRALAREDLRPGGKTNAEEEATAVHFILNELEREDLTVGEIKELAHELGTRTLFIGQWAGPSHNELEALHARFMSARQRRLGAIEKKEKPWMKYARILALKIPEKDRVVPNNKLVTKLWDMWAKEKPAEWTEVKPSRPESWDTILDFVSKLRADGTLPPGPTRATRPRG
jgi:hypothetical protein